MSARISKIFDATRPFSPSSVPARNTALLLLDYQVLTVTMLGESGTRCVQRAKDLKLWAKENNVSVFNCVVDVKGKPRSTSRMAERWERYETMIQQKPDMGNGVPELEPPTEENIFPRRPGHVSALSSPGILEALRAKEITSLILCGLSTSGCVLSTVRAAADLDFVVTVAEDACYDPVPNLHEMLVNHVLPSTAHVATSEETKNLWTNSE